MTIEELKELREIVHNKSCTIEYDEEYNDTQEYEIEDKELMWALEECEELIDSEIARQSVTDEDVKEAIEYLKEEYESSIKAYKYSECEENMRYWGKQATLAIIALESYKPVEVTDEDAKSAIHSIKEHIQLYRLRNYPQLNIGHALDLAILALQQMRTEGCHCCNGIESHGIKSVKTVTDKLGRSVDAYNTPYNYCPNCGKDLR